MVAPEDASNNSIELTLHSVQGVVWKPDKYASEENIVSRVKACVAFLGSAPNMQVSSFTMCPRTGNLVVESNGLECSKATSKTKPNAMSAKFDDPLEAKQTRGHLSSSHSASSGTSNSTYRPHLQFKLTDEQSTKPKTSSDKYEEVASKASSLNGDARSIELHVTLRSEDPDASLICVEGVAKLHIPEKFESLPITLDLPITPKPKAPTPVEQSSSSSTGGSSSSLLETPEDMLLFDKKASIRVVLSLAPHQSHDGSSKDPSSSKTEIVLSDNLDEIQLGGMMKQMHEMEEIEDARIRAAKLLNMRHLQENGAGAAGGDGGLSGQARRSWFLCSGSGEFGHSFESFFDMLKGCGLRRSLKSKGLSSGLDPDQDLFMAATMASTIDTRDSLEI